MISLYYDFAGGLISYEYNVNELDILKVIYKITGVVYDIKVFDTIYDCYHSIVHKAFEKQAFNKWINSKEYKEGLVDDDNFTKNHQISSKTKEEVQLCRRNKRKAKTQEKIAKMKKLQYQQMELKI